MTTPSDAPRADIQPRCGVSIIVPVHDDPEGIANVLDHLLACELPEMPVEIIVVDNGSTDGTGAVARSYLREGQPAIRLVEETETIGSYAARNKGLSVARGELIAFTDSDCSPTAQWIREGVDLLAADEADLVGGHVEFSFGSPVTGAELFDSISNMQIRQNIEARGVCKTANLFAKHACFDAVGCFPASLQSGGDVWWTSKATRAGLRLKFSPRAVVVHPARPWRALMRKQVRVGYGQIPVMRSQGRSTWSLIKNFCRLLTPPEHDRITKKIDRNPMLQDRRARTKAWWGCWASHVATAWGQIRYLRDLLLPPSRSAR